MTNKHADIVVRCGTTLGCFGGNETFLGSFPNKMDILICNRHKKRMRRLNHVVGVLKDRLKHRKDGDDDAIAGRFGPSACMLKGGGLTAV
jgi:hypothetical protein